MAALAALSETRLSNAVDRGLLDTEVVPRICREACKNLDTAVKVRACSYFLTHIFLITVMVFAITTKYASLTRMCYVLCIISLTNIINAACVRMILCI